MDIGAGGNRGKRNDKDDNRKKKGKGKEIAEDEMPRNRKYMEDEKKSGKRIKVSDDGNDPPANWDWRHYLGIMSNVLKQGSELICWAISFIRAIEALFNIGKRLEDQVSFSIQHLVNNIEIGVHGLEDSTILGDFILKHGFYEEGECSYTRTKQTCTHVDPKTERIDRFVVIEPVDDTELVRLVWKHPVVGVLPLWSDLSSHKKGIYKPTTSPAKYNQPIYHAVLIMGYGVDNFGRQYWIVQNSWGTGWGGEGGFGLLQRGEERGGRGSLFIRIYYGEKMGYPQDKKKKK